MVVLVGASADDGAGASAGTAYIYRYNGSAWPLEQELTVTDIFRFPTIRGLAGYLGGEDSSDARVQQGLDRAAARRQARGRRRRRR